MSNEDLISGNEKAITIVLFSLVLGIIFSFWMPEFFYPSTKMGWLEATIWGGFQGEMAPVTWIMSLFTDNIVKLHGQSTWFNICWWCGLISSIFSFLSVLMIVVTIILRKSNAK